MSDQEQENGVKAITTLLEVLGPLKAETRSNVLDYVFRTLGITPPAPAGPATHMQSPAAPFAAGPADQRLSGAFGTIRWSKPHRIV
jgi:hypothetical protein